METPKPPLAPALRAETARAERLLRDHPSPETLAAYHEHRLPAAEEERLRDHLALCTDCAQLLLDLFAFAEPETPATPAVIHGPTDVDLDAAWQSLRGRLGEAAAPAKVVPLQRPAPVRPRPSSWVWALAASWLAVAGLGFWVFELRQENARLAEPAVNAVVADLAASGDSTRGGAEPKPQVLPADRPLLLILNAPDVPASAGGYEAEILESGQSGPAVWTGRNVPRSPDNSFTLDLAPGFLRPGKYQVRLFSVGAGKRQPLADFPLRIGTP